MTLGEQILATLKDHGGWATSLTLRDKLPPGAARGEAFELELRRLIGAKAVQARIGDETTAVIYRVAENPRAPAPPAPVLAPGPTSAVTAAFHPAAVTKRAQAIGADEVPPPSPTKVSRSARRQESTMSSRNDEDSPRARILRLLSEGPARTGGVSKALKLSIATAAGHLKALADAGTIRKDGNQFAPWTLVNGKAAAAPKAGPGRAATPQKRRAQVAGTGRTAPKKPRTATPSAEQDGFELAVKLDVLKAYAEEARRAARSIHHFILTEIIGDLQRLHGAA